MASQTTSILIVYSTIYWGADQRKHENSASLGFVRVIHRWPLNSPHKGPVTRKMFSFDVVIMTKKWRHRDFQIMTPYRVIDNERYWFRLWLAVVRRQTITWTDMIYFNRALLNLKCIFFCKTVQTFISRKCTQNCRLSFGHFDQPWIHCDLVPHVATKIWVNIGSGYEL